MIKFAVPSGLSSTGIPKALLFSIILDAILYADKPGLFNAVHFNRNGGNTLAGIFAESNVFVILSIILDIFIINNLMLIQDYLEKV